MVWPGLLPYGSSAISKWGAPVPGLPFKTAALPFLLLGDCSFSPVKLVQRGGGVGKVGNGERIDLVARVVLLWLSQLLSSFCLEVSRSWLRGQQVAVLPGRSNSDVLGLMPLTCSPLPPLPHKKAPKPTTLKKTPITQPPNRISAGVHSCWKV